MEEIVGDRYAAFDARRRADEALAAEREAEEEIEQLRAEAARLTGTKPKKNR